MKLWQSPGIRFSQHLATIKYFFPRRVVAVEHVPCAGVRCWKAVAQSCPQKPTSLQGKSKMTTGARHAEVKVKDNLKIKVPQEVLGVKKWECEVVSNKNVATFIKEFVVKLPEGENLNFKSGGYIQIDVPKVEVDFKTIDIDEKYRDEWEKFGMFNLKMKNPEPTFRAYSMANHPAEGNMIMLNIRIATPPWDRANNAFKKVNPGICSSYIFSLKPGDKVDISGPYGDFFLKDNDNEMMFIGGGAGMAPMRSHLFHLFHTVKERNKKISFWYGARSWKEVFYYDQFREIEKNYDNFEFHLALSEPLPDDKWDGPPVSFIR